MTAPMTFHQWQATGKRTPPLVALHQLGIDETTYRGSPVTAIWIYEGSLFIEELSATSYYCMIGRQDHTFEQRMHAEMWLYFEWAVSEVFDSRLWTEASLSTLLGEFATWSSLDPASADEMIVNPAATLSQTEWLSWFIRTWEDTVDRKPIFEPTLTARLGDQAIEFGNLSNLLSEAMQAIIDLDKEVTRLRKKLIGMKG